PAPVLHVLATAPRDSEHPTAPRDGEHAAAPRDERASDDEHVSGERADDATHGVVVGYAAVRHDDGATPSAELVVHPDHRRRGLGSALLAEVLAHRPAPAVWAHGDLPGAQA